MTDTSAAENTEWGLSVPDSTGDQPYKHCPFAACGNIVKSSIYKYCCISHEKLDSLQVNDRTCRTEGCNAYRYVVPNGIIKAHCKDHDLGARDMKRTKIGDKLRQKDEIIERLTNDLKQRDVTISSMKEDIDYFKKLTMRAFPDRNAM